MVVEIKQPKNKSMSGHILPYPSADIRVDIREWYISGVPVCLTTTLYKHVSYW